METDKILAIACRLGQRFGIESAERFMQRKGILTFGIEYVGCAGREIAYVNRGDTYDSTVCVEGDDCFVSSWGDWYEDCEAQHESEENVIRCGHCGEFTDFDCADWRDCECSTCGHLVGG